MIGKTVVNVRIRMAAPSRVVSREPTYNMTHGIV